MKMIIRNRSPSGSFIFCVSFISLFCIATGLEKTDLFPFRDAAGEETEAFVTESSSSIQLSVPIVLYGVKHTTAHISPKGIITFGQEPAAALFEDRPFPLTYAAIAPFYADIEQESEGFITYRESKKQEVLDKANSLIHQHFPDQSAFQTQSVLIATWDDVPGRGNPAGWTNTFQVAVANSGEDSFAIFLYPTGKIVWGQSKDSLEAQTGTFAQAGFMSGDGKVTKIDGSGTDYIRGLPNNKDPESADPGLYLYRIGQVAAETTTESSREGESHGQEQDYAQPEEDVEPVPQLPVTREPIDERHPLDPANLRPPHPTGETAEGEHEHAEDNTTARPDKGSEQAPTYPAAPEPDRSQNADHHHHSESGPLQVTRTLQQQGNPVCRDASECHADAHCRPYPSGSCCECKPQFWGNGKLCIDKESAQRMNGHVSGRVNGVEFKDGMMHNYIVVQEGRVYVAYSPIPNEIGNTLQTILPVSTIVGWLFALPENGLPNGLTITGGVFNHTATVRFVETGETVHISQRFSGLDEHKMLHSVLYINGNAPTVTAGQNTEFADHNIEYRRSTPGTIQSSSRHAVQIGDKSHPYTVEESVSYYECPHHEDANAARTTRLQVSRVVSLYQTQEKASRFGMDGKITLYGQGGPDVCLNVECGPTASCVPQGEKGQCICRAGYQVAPGADAAAAGPLNCVDIDECATRNECSPQAECINTQGSFQCRCLSGYSGDGRQCRTTEEIAPDPTCDTCDPNADCVPDQQNNRQICRCRPGYSGDGTRCSLSQSQGDCLAQPELCDINARCERDPRGQPACVCFPGYVGDGRLCRLQGPQAQPSPSPDSCYHNPAQCDKNAACVPDAQGSGYACQCLAGFDGDGRTCRARLVTRGGFLAFTQGMSVVKLPLDRTSPERGGQVAILPGQTAVGIAVDCTDSYIFWSDIAGNTINRARYDGSSVEVVLRNIQSAEGLAVDPYSRNIFWTDSASDHIAVAKLTDVKAGHKVIISKDLSNPRALAIHPSRGAIFWTDWNRVDPKIETANMDGTERRVLVDKDLGLPNALTVDLSSDDICWADAGNQKVECVAIDGNNRRMVYHDAKYPFSMTAYQNHLYWTDWSSNNIMSVRKGGGEAKSHELPIGSSGKVYGIVAVPEECPRLTNACASGNGGCRFICLPLPNGSRKCACPDNLADDQCSEDPVYRT